MSSIEQGHPIDSAEGVVVENEHGKKSLSRKIKAFVWDTLDKSPVERKLVTKLDFWILTYICLAYFVKYLDQ